MVRQKFLFFFLSCLFYKFYVLNYQPNCCYFASLQGLNNAAETLKQEAELTTTTKAEEKTMPGTPSFTIPRDAFEMSSSVKSNNNTPLLNRTFSTVIDSTPFSSPQAERRVDTFLLL